MNDVLCPTAARRAFLTLTITRWFPVGLVIGAMTLLPLERGLTISEALLAFSDPAEIRTLLRLPRGGRLPRFTGTTISSLTALKDELARTRERGFSICRGEFENTAWGVSAPVLDVLGRPVAVLSIWGPGERVTDGRFDELGKAAVVAAQQIAARSSAGRKIGRAGQTRTK